MSRIPLLLAVALALQQGSACADDLNCVQTYRQTLFTCARSLNLLHHDLRTGAQQACVEGARLTLAHCTSQSDLCVEGCVAAYGRHLTERAPERLASNPQCKGRQGSDGSPPPWGVV